MFSSRQFFAQISELMRKIAALPGKDYPPANIAQMIKQCEKSGRKDLGHKIMEQWNKVVDKYPASRVNWGAATKIGTSSVKKNVFGGAEFMEWFSSAAKVPSNEIEKVPEPKVHVPAIAIPEDGETAEDWQHAAAKTASILDEAEAGFANADEFLVFLKKTVGDLERKLQDYGPGGEKELTKKGLPHKFVERLPKWEAELKAYAAKITEVESKLKDAGQKFKKAKKAYEHAPVTTVAYEKKAQDSLQNVLHLILNVEDAKQQKEMLEKFEESLEKMKNNKAASLSRRAGIFDTVFEAINHVVGWIKTGWHALLDWAHKLSGSIDEFEEVAERLGR